MMKLPYKNSIYTIKELSDISGIPPATIRDRLRRGYRVEEAITPKPTHRSVKEFCANSWYEDWIGMTTNNLYQVYWKWCIKNIHVPVGIQLFTRQIIETYPTLKIVPMMDKEGKYHRYIRLR